MRPHELHECPIHAQDDDHLQIVVGEQGVALRQHVVGTGEDPLAVRLGREGAELADRGARHGRNPAKLNPPSVHALNALVQLADVEGHEVLGEVERCVILVHVGQVRVQRAPVDHVLLPVLEDGLRQGQWLYRRGARRSGCSGLLWSLTLTWLVDGVCKLFASARENGRGALFGNTVCDPNCL